MSITEVKTVDEMTAAIDSNGVTVVDFAALAWCVPCQRLQPHYEAVAEKMTDVKFLSVDIDSAEELREYYQIQSVPTILAFKDGEFVGPVQAKTAPKLFAEISNL